MELGIRGRKAIVCASSRGLGRACAMALAAEGVDVVVNGRDAGAVDKTADDIRTATGVTVTAVAGDISTPEGQAALLAACPDPDILINNNGGPPARDYRSLDREAILAGVVQNMATPIALIQRVVDGMVERGFGRIVNITSSSVRSPILGLDLSSGARAGLTAFLAGPARDLARHNVTINNILPGVFDTDRLKSLTKTQAEMQGKNPDEVAADSRDRVPAKRFGHPEEFGRLCAFLCSDAAGYIVGQNILIDGGRFNATI